MNYEFASLVEKWESGVGWVFVRLPKDAYAELQSIGKPAKRGFGSLRVSATIGNTTWKTSIFPDSEDRSYILFVKKDVRKTENTEVGDSVELSVRLVDV